MFFVMALVSCANFGFSNLEKGITESLEACMVLQDLAAFDRKIHSQPREFFAKEGERLLKFALAEEERGSDLRPFIEKLLFNFSNPFIEAPEKYAELFEFSRKRVVILESFNKEESLLNEEEFVHLTSYCYEELSMLESIAASFSCSQIVELARKFHLAERDVVVGNKNFYTLLAENKRPDVLEMLLDSQNQSKLWEKQEGLDTALYTFAKADLLPAVIQIYIKKGIDRKELLISMEDIEKLHQYINEEAAQLLSEDLRFCFDYSLDTLCKYISRSGREKGKFLDISEIISLEEDSFLSDEQVRALKFLFKYLYNLAGEEAFIVKLLDKRSREGYVVEVLFSDVEEDVRSRMLQYDNNFFRAAFSKLEDIERLSALSILVKEAGFNLAEKICKKLPNEAEGKDMLTEVIQTRGGSEKLKILLRERLSFDRLEDLLIELRSLEGMDMVRRIVRHILAPENLNIGGNA